MTRSGPSWLLLCVRGPETAVRARSALLATMQASFIYGAVLSADGGRVTV